MKATASLVITGGLALALWGGVVSRDVLAQAEAGRSVPAITPPKAADPVSVDADRRVALNARLNNMLAEGKGGRLTDVDQKTPRRSSSQRAQVGGVNFPPEQRASSTVSRTGRYVEPKLDLVTPAAMPRDAVTCLTQAIYYEARSENEEGQAAVAEVVMNRAASGRYPSDICEVVYQRNARTCQFTFTCDGSIGRSRINPVAWARAERIAREVYSEGYKSILPRRSVNYHANYVRPSWSRRLEQVQRIGAHIFYGAPLDGRTTPGADDPKPARDTGLMFVKNEAIERAYAALMGRPSAAPET